MGNSRPLPNTKAVPKISTYVWQWCFQNNLIAQNLIFLSITFQTLSITLKILHDHVDITIFLTRIILTSSMLMYSDIQRMGRTYTLTWGGGNIRVMYNGRCWKMVTFSIDTRFYIIDFILSMYETVYIKISAQAVFFWPVAFKIPFDNPFINKLLKKTYRGLEC